MDVLFIRLNALISATTHTDEMEKLVQELKSTMDPIRRDIMKTARRALFICAGESSEQLDELKAWVKEYEDINADRYNSYLYSQSDKRIEAINEVKAEYSENSVQLNGFEILNKCFENNFNRYPELIAFGEDLGKIGDVNQGFAGLQEKFGEDRILM